LEQEELEMDLFLGLMVLDQVLLLELPLLYLQQVVEEEETDLTHQHKIVVQEKMVHLEDQVAVELDNSQVHQVQVVDLE
jgi:hypothetical protein